ncbi:MAG: twin-arginine translocase subunit TatC [Parvularculales bacterium]
MTFTPTPTPAPDDEDAHHIEASKAPLLAHLIELRGHVLFSLIVFVVMFGLCFYLAPQIFNILLYPYERASEAGDSLQLIYTAPQEFLLTQIRLALFGALFLSFPVMAVRLYMFVAPGLYRQERRAFLPFLAATPVLFLLGSLLVYFVIMPLALAFFLDMEQAGGPQEAAITLMPRVSEYLSLAMTLIFAFGLCFQLPVLLTLLARVGLLQADSLRRQRKYAVVGVFALAAVLTPPDIISQIGLGVPTLLLYELSIFCVAAVERKQAAQRMADNTGELAS